MRAGPHAQREAKHVPVPVTLKLTQLGPQVDHRVVVGSERGPVAMVLVELPFIVRPHVPDRPRWMLIHPAAAVPGAPPEQQATAASLNLLQWNTCCA